MLGRSVREGRMVQVSHPSVPMVHHPAVAASLGCHGGAHCQDLTWIWTGNIIDSDAMIFNYLTFKWLAINNHWGIMRKCEVVCYWSFYRMLLWRYLPWFTWDMNLPLPTLRQCQRQLLVQVLSKQRGSFPQKKPVLFQGQQCFPPQVRSELLFGHTVADHIII